VRKLLSNRKNLVLDVAIVTIAHIEWVHPAFFGLLFLAMAWRIQCERQVVRWPGQFVITSLVMLGLVGVFVIYGRPIGVIPASAVLLVSLSSLLLRPVEKKNTTLIFGCCFILVV